MPFEEPFGVQLLVLTLSQLLGCLVHEVRLVLRVDYFHVLGHLNLPDVRRVQKVKVVLEGLLALSVNLS